MPRTLYELRRFVGRHIGLVPIAIVIMAIVFAISFRSLTAAMLPLIEVGACLAAVFGLMGWTGVPIYLTIAVMPVILTAIGVADEIHVFARYVQELRARPDAAHRESLLVAMDEMWVPVVKTSVTTAVGFLSFAASPQAPVRAFGVFTAVGIIFCMLWSLTVIPAMLALIRPGRFVRAPKARAAAPLSERVFTKLGTAMGRGRYVVLVLALLAVAIAPFGVSKVIVQDSWIDGFAPDSRFYRATQFFNEQFLGTHLLLLHVKDQPRRFKGQVSASALGRHEIVLPGDVVDNPEILVSHRLFLRRPEDPGYAPEQTLRRRRPNEWKTRIEAVERDDGNLVLTHERRSGSPRILFRLQPDVQDKKLDYEILVEPFMIPENLQRIEALEEFIESLRDFTVGGVLGTASYISTAHFMARSLTTEEARSIPESPERVEWVWNHFKRVRGQERLRQLVDDAYGSTLVTIFLKNANFVDVKALMAAIRDYEREHLKPHDMSIGFAGDVAVSQTVIGAIVKTQRWSLIGSLIGILAITTLMGRSLRWGLLSVLPCSLAILINFAIMGWIGMPLGVATSMFAGMTLGIGVDFAIHLLERYRLSRSRGSEAQAAVTDALTVAGPAIFIDAVAVALGFGIMTLSQVPANARLGALLVLSILGCLAATLLLLPALLRLIHPLKRRYADADASQTIE
jgi:predicted RND superfamily exporter protein